MFELLKKRKEKRLGLLKTRRGVVKTPVFMPIATKAAVKSLTPEELKALGAELILGNTYHLWLRPGPEIVRRAGGLHDFMNWSGPILTDSGGYQVFSLGRKIFGGWRDDLNSAERESCSLSAARSSPIFDSRKARIKNAGLRSQLSRPAEGAFLEKKGFVLISRDGVEFRDPFDGRKHFLTPEKSIEIQLALGSDIIMVLDECPPYPASRAEVEEATKRTTEWATRCKKYFSGKIHPNPPLKKEGTPPFYKGRLGGIYRPLLFGIVQGSIYKDLREKSARELLDCDFDGYAIGGVAVGEPRKYLWQVLKWVLPLLPEDKPRYLMGLGRPEEIVAAVMAGIDMFDCVIPTREARHGRIYIKNPNDKFPMTKKSQMSKSKKFYKTIQITKVKFAKDLRPLDENCGCYACKNFSRAYLHYLFRIGEPLAQRLATIHNLKFYLDLMRLLQK